jgi:hypothetical protein
MWKAEKKMQTVYVFFPLYRKAVLILLLFFRPFWDVESATVFFLLYIENHGYNMKEYFDT